MGTGPSHKLLFAACLLTTAGCLPGMPLTAEDDRFPSPPMVLRGSVSPGTLAEHALSELDANVDIRVLRQDRSPTHLNVGLFDGDAILARRSVAPGGSCDLQIPWGVSAARLVVAGAVADATYELHVFVGNPADEGAEPLDQVVYLSFHAARDVQIHQEPAIDVEGLRAAAIAGRYAGRERELSDAIVSKLRTQYTDYRVDFLSSWDGPAPEGPHSTLYFGGDHPYLLGLADQLDRGNRDRSDNAIVFTDAFALYSDMGLDPNAAARMISNVAAHELGHLLGLYHTADPRHVMDTSGGIYDLASARTLSAPAPLAADVFPTGEEDAPRMLALAVGRKAESRMQKVQARPAPSPPLPAGEPVSICGLRCPPRR